MSIPRSVWAVTFVNHGDPPAEWYVNTLHESKAEAIKAMKKEAADENPDFLFVIREYRLVGQRSRSERGSK